MALPDAVALVTGASSGIGWATALRLAASGATVVALGRDRRRLAELARRCGAHPVVADLADPAETGAAVRSALRVAGRVDILVNNAGQGWAGPFAGQQPADADRLLAVNLAAPIALTRGLLPAMVERGAGRLVFVTSIAGRTAVAGEAVYAATKAGLDAFAESLRLELHGSGVAVSIVVPGVVSTEFFTRRGRPYTRVRPRPCSPDTVAAALVRALDQGRAEVYAPGWLRVPVAVRGTAPGVYRRLAVRFGGQS